MQKKVSIIIPTYNQRKDVLDCISSIYKQSYKNIEIIVIDNASADNTADAIEKKFPKVILLRNKSNEGVTGAANKGVKKATGDYVCFVDHDMILEGNYIKELVDVLESDKKIGEVVGKILYDEDHGQIWAAGTAINLYTGQIFFRGGKDRGQYDKAEEIQVTPANFMLRKSFIDRFGAYDPIYIIGYEDTDLSFRVRKEGFKVLYVPDAVACHRIPLKDEDAGRRLLSRSYWIGRNRIIFMKRWGNFGVFVFFVPIFSLYYLFLALRYQRLGSFISYLLGIWKGLWIK